MAQATERESVKGEVSAEGGCCPPAKLLLEQYKEVRRWTERVCEPLTPEDLMVQSCAEASPAKWHLAHTSWFYETFVLRGFVAGYKEFDANFGWLFNSYYNSLGEHPEKKLRASFSRPPVDAIFAYRRHVDAAVERLLAEDAAAEALARIEMGLHHEQQHTELIVTDIKHAFWTNPLHPAYTETLLPVANDAISPGPVRWIEFQGGLHATGFEGASFAFDNESPRHLHYSAPFRLANRAVMCGEYLEFMQDGGYRRPELWLSQGWDAAKAAGWTAPLYWRKNGDSEKAWEVYTLGGMKPLTELIATPVCHVSFYEADAFARWAGKRLPTEQEWELAAERLPVEGNLLEDQALHPIAATGEGAEYLQQMFGDVWEWTQSPYIGYPGYKPLPGALGEYNGKFMSNQMVLRGGSVATPVSHIRATYRNFFSPETRWQFSGIRLADDATTR